MRVEIVIAGNVASQKVAEKVGARREGLLRNRLELRRRISRCLHVLARITSFSNSRACTLILGEGHRPISLRVRPAQVVVPMAKLAVELAQ